jgi:hypothetical protein
MLAKVKETCNYMLAVPPAEGEKNNRHSLATSTTGLYSFQVLLYHKD